MTQNTDWMEFAMMEKAFRQTLHASLPTRKDRRSGSGHTRQVWEAARVLPRAVRDPGETTPAGGRAIIHTGEAGRGMREGARRLRKVRGAVAEAFRKVGSAGRKEPEGFPRTGKLMRNVPTISFDTPNAPRRGARPQTPPPAKCNFAPQGRSQAKFGNERAERSASAASTERVNAGHYRL